MTAEPCIVLSELVSKLPVTSFQCERGCRGE